LAVGTDTDADSVRCWLATWRKFPSSVAATPPQAVESIRAQAARVWFAIPDRRLLLYVDVIIEVCSFFGEAAGVRLFV
jgi:hypothetical protein